MAKISGVADVKNTLRATAEEENTIIGGNLADRLYGSAYNDNIYGGSGNDYIYVGNGENAVNGQAGDDTIIGGASYDYYTIAIGEGNDTIIDKGGSGDSLTASFLTSATSGVFIKRGNDLIVAEGTVNLTGDADGDGDDTEDLATEIAGIQALASTAARQAGMRSIVSNLTNSAIIKNYFTTGEIEEVKSIAFTVKDQTIMTNLVNYSTGLKYFNQAVTNPNIVRGTGAADFILASASNQKLIGGKGDDVYYIDAMTDVVIQDTAGSYDSLIFDDNNGGANVYSYTKQGNDLKITFDDGSGVVVASAIIKNFYNRNGAQIDKVGSDADGDISAGVVYDSTYVGAVCDNVAALTSAAKVLRGTVTDDQLTVAAGQTAYGLAGNDEYTVTAGKVIINDTGSTYVHSSLLGDVLNADHLATETDGVFIRRGNDLIIVDGGDAVTGYADADAAVADLTNLNNAQRRTVLNNLIKMTDSITVRNYFTTGEMETINALNNTAIDINSELLPNLIDYSTGLLASAKSTGKTRVNGTSGIDYILASASNQKLYGGNGSDVYAIPGGLSNVEIWDFKGDFDVIKFTQADLNGADSYEVARQGNDLVISVTDGVDGDSSVIIKNHFLNDNNNVEKIEDFDAGVNTYIAKDRGVNRYRTYGSAGDDTIIGKADMGNYIYGGDGDDSIYAYAWSNDLLYGGDGNDTLKANGGTCNDSLYGQEGSDVYELMADTGNIEIYEVDATADDTDKVVFVDADFTDSSCSIDLMKIMNMANFTYTDSDGTLAGFRMSNYYAGGSDQIEVLEDAYGNSINLATGAVTGTVNLSLTIWGDFIGDADTITAPDTDTTINGLADNDNLTGGIGNDTIYGGDGNDVMLDGGDGNDYIDGGDGNDGAIRGGDGNDTLIGGLGMDGFDPGNGNDVILYNLDDGVGENDIAFFTIGEDIVRFTTSATGSIATSYRDQIAIWSADDSGTSDLQIGYGWDESTQAYANEIWLLNYDSTSETGATVIEFITGDATYTLTDTEIETLLDEIVTNDTSANLTAVHDDGIDGAGQQLQMIVAAW